MKKSNLLLYFSLCTAVAWGQVSPILQTRITQQIKEIEPKIIEWRRQFHQYPELSNHEVKTGAKIAEFLKSLGMEVHYPVAVTGVVGILKGSKPGPVIALRADMDGLPIAERNSLPFASKEKAFVDGRETGVMHACGHDSHMAMLMGVAEILSKNKNELKGTIKFLFQPAEEGLPPGEEGGAYLMIKEGVLENPKVDVVFGLHIQSWLPLGTLAFRSGPLMAAVDGLNIKVKGKGAHGAWPWESIDPIVVSSQIILGLQTIVSRQTDLTKGAAVITIGSFLAGVRRNIIPEEALLEGTIRTLEPQTQKTILEKITLTATKIAESAGASAEVSFNRMYPVTSNDPHLTGIMLPSLQRTVGPKNVNEIPPIMGAEDFSFFQQHVPGLFFFLGANPADMHLDKIPGHHTADFMIDERSFIIGVNSILNLTLDYMFMPKK
jgi:amidohydrolase